ncbi:S-methyl-5-thioribose-1-phosphate isomerase [candidate division WOR-3 bacterium]|nr:S-methyl-5-thioribose-1-phosphate isomerase [candidate division WOR-3 bacterium]
MRNSQDFPRPLFWQNNCLLILDQRKLPFNEDYLRVNTVEEAAAAISEMAVRGAPAIGITAVFAWALGIFQKYPREKIEYILSRTRPTARDLFTALGFMKNWQGDALEGAEKYLKIAVENEEKLVINASSLIPEKSFLITHCNTGFLAYYRWGTAFGAAAWAHEIEGKEVFLWVKETRPRLQGTLTAWEASKRNIPHRVIVDSAAAHVMKTETIDAVIIGADRISKNLDVANKIGSLDLAICAKHFGVPFYVVAPETTFDNNIFSASDFVIEERSSNEIKSCGGSGIFAVNESGFFNPAFDAVPSELITAVATENGILHPRRD